MLKSEQGYTGAQVLDSCPRDGVERHLCLVDYLRIILDMDFISKCNSDSVESFVHFWGRGKSLRHFVELDQCLVYPKFAVVAG